MVLTVTVCSFYPFIVYWAAPLFVVHAHLYDTLLPKLRRSGPECKSSRSTRDRIPLETKKRLPMHETSPAPIVSLSPGRHKMDFLLYDLAGHFDSIGTARNGPNNSMPRNCSVMLPRYFYWSTQLTFYNYQY